MGGFADEVGSPHYDLIVWLSGSVSEEPLDTDTKDALALLLDSGGNVLSSGDDFAFALAQGTAADPTFLATYFGVEVAANDDATDDPVLTASGTAPPLVGDQFSLYGSCPGSHPFDRLTLATPDANSVITELATYTNGQPADEGRASVVENDRTGGGVAVHAAFDLAAIMPTIPRGLGTPDDAVALFLEQLITGSFGLASPGSANDAPVVTLGPQSLALGRVAPSPFRDGTTVEFELPRQAKATICVYDVGGRVVRTLVDASLPPGRHHVTWNGLGNDGLAASSGVYFVRMTSGDFRATRRVVRLR